MNVAGAGPFSEVVACMTPASVPAVVTCLRGLSEDEVESPHYSPSTCLAISWEEPCDHGSEILGYSIDFGDKQPITVGKDLTYFIEGLQPDTTYRYVCDAQLLDSLLFLPQEQMLCFLGFSYCLCYCSQRHISAQPWIKRKFCNDDHHKWMCYFYFLPTNKLCKFIAVLLYLSG